MILLNEPSKNPVQLTETEPPPIFEESTPAYPSSESSELLPHNAPPEFSVYEAQFVTVGDGDIVSHDPHLNSDGEALYRFLLSRSGKPGLKLHCHGDHTETRTNWVTTRENGRQKETSQSESHTVVDFDFSIDMGQYILPEHVAWSVPDDEPAYRGGMVKEVEDSLHQRYHPGRKVLKEYDNWRKHRAGKGLPPWARPLDKQDYVHQPTQLRSSHTLRQWADDYCQSNKHLKEWVYEKVIYGWDFDQLETAVRAAISSTFYTGNVTVTIIPSATKVYIRPDNWLSRTLSKNWVKVVLMVMLIYPFIWVYRRFSSGGGGRWEICGEAYPLKRIEATDAAIEGSSSGSSLASWKVVGLKEGEFFKLYEDTIIRAVNQRYQTSIPITTPVDGHATHAARLLDGY